MFKNKNFIEQNSFSTTHQSVNVYSEAEMLYEIRCEETAIDIQVSKQKVKASGISLSNMAQTQNAN